MTETVGGAPLGALSHRNFRLFFFGQAVSLSGTWMQTVAQGWLVLQLTDSPFYVGLVSSVGSLGVLLLTLYAGVVADRVDKRRTVVLTQTLQMLEAFALAALVWTRTVTVHWVIALAAVFGIVNAFDIPTRQSFLAEMVGKEDLLSAIALNSSLFNATRVLGPALAGVLIGAWGVGVCFFLNGVSYLAVIWGLLALAGCARIVNNARTNTTLQTLVPDYMRGRVMGFYSFVFVGMAPLGAFQAGVFAEHAGAPAAVAAGGFVTALVVLLAAWRVPELRTAP